MASISILELESIESGYRVDELEKKKNEMEKSSCCCCATRIKGNVLRVSYSYGILKMLSISMLYLILKM